MDIFNNNSNNTDSETSFDLFESEEQNNFTNINCGKNEDVEINSNIISCKSVKSVKSVQSVQSAQSVQSVQSVKFDKTETVVEPSIITSANIEKIFIREELLKRKTYYKILLSDYKKFIKKINYNSINTETSYDASFITRKSVDKSKIYNIKDTHASLYNNIKNIKKDLYIVFEKFNNKILILDGENILKSFKYQQLIKQYITQSEYEYYFNYWYSGSDNGFIQPMTSLNLSVSEKIYLIDKIVTNYLTSFNCIIMLSGKTNIDSNIKSTFINYDKSIIIPVIYNKEDIREQDDHLLVYIFYHLSKLKNCEIISGDKFKWFNHSNNYLKNFVLEYNFDEQKININILDAYTNDIIIYKNYKYQLGYYYFPFIKNISYISPNNLEIDNNMLNNLISNDYNQILELLTKKEHSELISLIINIFLILIELNYNYEPNIILIKKYSDFIISFISKINNFYKSIFDEILLILSRLTSINKKIFDKINKYDSYTLYSVIFESNDNLSNLSSLTIDWLFTNNLSNNKNITNIDITKLQEYIKFKRNIEDYIFITEIYLIFKSMSFLLNSGKPIVKIAKMFSYIIKIYDTIENSIHKIRKISNSLNDFNKIFLSLLSHHIFMKKNGFCKKDY